MLLNPVRMDLDDPRDILLFYDSSDRLEYVCMAKPGAKETEAAWQIRKITYVGATENISTVRYAEGSANFVFQVTRRTEYSYDGNMVTVLKAMKNITCPYTYDVTTGNADYSVIGDPADIGGSEAFFNLDSTLVIELDGVELKKGVDVEWVDSTHIRVNKPLTEGTSIIIRS